MVNPIAERRRKRLLSKAHNFLITAQPALLAALHREIRDKFADLITNGLHGLPFTSSLQFPDGIRVSAHPDFAAYALQRLSLAGSVRLLLGQFRVHSYPELYDRVSRIDWPVYIADLPAEITVRARVSRLHHTENIASSVASAIARARREISGLEARPPAQIVVRLFRDEASISLDLAGEPLYRRGFRNLTASAPLRETIAAGLMYDLIAGCAGPVTFIDAFCGSGTFATEAVQLSRGLPFYNRSFAVTDLPFHKLATWNHILKSHSLPVSKIDRVVLLDSDPAALALASENLQRLGEPAPEVLSIRADFASDWSSQIPADWLMDRNVLLTANPPWGHRMGRPGDFRPGAVIDHARAILPAGMQCLVVTPAGEGRTAGGDDVIFESGGVRLKASGIRIDGFAGSNEPIKWKKSGR